MLQASQQKHHLEAARCVLLVLALLVLLVLLFVLWVTRMRQRAERRRQVLQQKRLHLSGGVTVAVAGARALLVSLTVWAGLGLLMWSLVLAGRVVLMVLLVALAWRALRLMMMMVVGVGVPSGLVLL